MGSVGGHVNAALIGNHLISPVSCRRSDYDSVWEIPNLRWGLGNFEHCFLGVFFQVILPLVLGTTSSKKDLIGRILREM